jgi:glycosyltransferase involved in cell wall biosynthesis
VRSVQQQKGIRLRRRLLTRLLRRHADGVIAIDSTVEKSLPDGIQACVIHNGFAPEFAEEPSAEVVAMRQRFHSGSLRVGMVGSLLPLKGVYEFVEAARISRENGVNADFVIVGDNLRPLSGIRGRILNLFGFAHDVERDLRRLIERYALHDRVQLQGFTPRISSIYESLDLLCFPSHLSATGRPVLEAAWFGVPSLAAVEQPEPDTFVDGVTGVCIPARDPEAIAFSIARLCGDRTLLKSMGEAARCLAEKNFDSSKNARLVLELYRQLRDNNPGVR